ncbi:MAG: peptidylprolyl isomerase, partial [Paracoccaceae bacterium]
TVNDDVITETEFESRLATVKAQLRQAGQKVPRDERLRRQILERMIVEHVQIQLAERTGIRVGDAEIDKSVALVAKQNRLNEKQLRRALARDGVSFADFRATLKDQLILRRLIDRDINRRITVSETEVERFLSQQKPVLKRRKTQYKISHIAVAAPEDASEEILQAAGQRVADLHRRLKSGLNFARAAREYSQAPEAARGGSLGWREASQFPPEIRKKLLALRPGQISDVMRSSFGFHIIRLDAKRSAQDKQVINETRVRHILLRTSEVFSADDARIQLQRFRRRLLNGEDFSVLARAYSQDPASAQAGGEVGWVMPGVMVPRFQKAMDALAVNEISEPVLTRFGLHLIQVMDRRQLDANRAREREAARRQIHKQKSEERFDRWLRRLRDEAYVDYVAEEFKDI